MHFFSHPLTDYRAIHFIGIGGIGMRGLAEFLHELGANVQGSDAGSGPHLAALQAVGVHVHTGGHAAEYLQDADLVVVSSAIQPDNPELVAAGERGLRVFHRGKVLAEIAQHYQTIAITGTHGKTSTTALTWAALQAAGVPSGIINGGVLQGLGKTFQRPPTVGDWLVVEADESDKSFLHLQPDVAVVLNLEPEHMETYGTPENLIAAAGAFVQSAKRGVVLNLDDKGARQLKPYVRSDLRTYGTIQPVHNHIHAITVQGWDTLFSTHQGVFRVALPGYHFAGNATAALTAARYAGAQSTQAGAGLATFAGVARRFTRLGQFKGADVVDDYAHHPTEIKATLQAARQVLCTSGSTGRLIAVVQPHRFTRLRDHFDDFAVALDAADIALLVPVYAAGEAPIAQVNEMTLAHHATRDMMVVETLEALGQVLADFVLPGDLVLCMGAGSITQAAHALVRQGA